MKTFMDSRDGEIYKIVKIGNLYWFAENLRYQGVYHRFPNRDSDNVHRYGCLYTWEDAMKACPKGWRLPTKTNFDHLRTYVTNNRTAFSNFLALIKNDSAWTFIQNKADDEFGFSAMPAGYYDHSGHYNYFGSSGRWWSSTECYSSNAYHLYLGLGLAEVCNRLKNESFSVRCVKEIA